MPGFARIFCISISFAALLSARSYNVDGLVLAVSPPVFTVAHRPIPGYMQAMTMDFRAASSSEVSPLQPGMRVRFVIRDQVARDIKVVPADEDDMPAPAVQPRLGDPAPGFQLIDSTGKTAELGLFRRRLVVLNFLYTRCPMPEVCPRLAASFATLQKRFRSSLGRDLVLLSITIDPEWDTPPVLAEYAQRWQADPDGWRFLTGTPEAVRKAATSWGLVYWPEEGAIAHTSRTALIGRDGRLLAMVEGSSYRVDQLIELIGNHLKAPQ